MFDMDQPKITVNCKISYPLSWRQGVQNSTKNPETKREFVNVALSVRENIAAVLCIRWRQEI